MNKELLHIFSKYIICLLIIAMAELRTKLFIFLKFEGNDLALASKVLILADWLATILIIVFLIRDAIKLKLSVKLLLVITVCGCIYPLLAVVILALLFLEQQNKSENSLNI